MAKGSQGSNAEALHPLVLRAAEEQEQETFLNDIIAKIHRAGVLEARRAHEPFPGLHSEIRKLLQGEGIQRFYEYLIPLFAGLARVPSLDLPQDDRWLRIRALPVPADMKLWFKAEVDAVLHSVGLASEGALHPNRQYEELVALMLLWPEPIEDAHELPWLPLGFGVEDDGRTPPQVPTEPDIRSRMRDAADRIRGYLHRPWQQYGASPHGSSTKSKRNKAAKDEAKLDAGRKAYKLREQGVAPWDVPYHPEFESEARRLKAVGVRVPNDPGPRSKKADSQWTLRLINRHVKANPDVRPVSRGRRPGLRWD